MLEVDQVHECRKLSGQGVPIRQIAAQLGVSRNTVRRYLRGAPAGVYQLQSRRIQPVIDQVSGIVRQILKEEKEACVPRKQRITAARIYRILRTEHGYLGSDRSVRNLVREVRGELRDPLSQSYVPLDYEPGEDAQVDFFEAAVDHESRDRSKTFVLLVRPCFSGRVFVYMAPNQTQEALFEGLIRAFVFFGGVFRHLWFDNLTPAVQKVLRGRERKVQETFEKFMAFYGFVAEFCQPACGNEKGGVENNVKFVRSELFTPIPQDRSRSDLQDDADAFMRLEEQRTMRGRDRSIGELWELEKSNLLPLPATAFEVGEIKPCRVSNRCWIAHGTNFYSVPAHLAGQHVQVRLGAEKITVTSRDSIVAVHSRLYGKNQMALELEHYLPLLERKLRAIDRALPMKLWLERRAPGWRQLLVELRRREGEFDGSKGFVDAVKMCGVHGTEVVTEAVTRALRRTIVSIPIVRFELDGLIAASKPAPEKVEYAGPESRDVSARDYDSMLEMSHG